MEAHLPKHFSKLRSYSLKGKSKICSLTNLKNMFHIRRMKKTKTNSDLQQGCFKCNVNTVNI